jgi:hypothetical protein
MYELFGMAGIELGHDCHIGDVRNDGSMLILLGLVGGTTQTRDQFLYARETAIAPIRDHT